MFSKTSLKSFLLPTVSISLAICLVLAFYAASLNVIQTFTVARMSALGTLKPAKMDYLWELSMRQAPVHKGRLRYYADYYEHLLNVFPSLWSAYGVLGYCYYYLGDEPKAIEYLKKAIAHDPLYSWNYYNLGVIYLRQSKYEDALNTLRQLQFLEPEASLQRIFVSSYVYLPLIETVGKDAIPLLVEHLKLSFRGGFDLVRLMTQMNHNKELEKIIKQMPLEIYVF